MADDTLRRLASMHGVASSYRNASGHEVEVNADVLRAVLASLGVPAATEAAARDALREQVHRGSFGDYVVLRGGRCRIRVPVNHSFTEAEVVTEGGDVFEMRIPGGTRTLLMPAELPVGYHTLRLHGPGHGQDVTILRAPEQCPSFGERRLWGWMVQLYACRSHGSWGIGDFEDLAMLARESATRFGAAFILSSPTAAVAPTEPQQPSPYYPSSRQYSNPIYLRPERVVEAVAPPSVDVVRVLGRLGEQGRALNGSRLIDRDATFRLKMGALEALYRLPRSPAQTARFDAYRLREGKALQRFATFCALAEQYGGSFKDWPEVLQSPGAAAGSIHADVEDRAEFHAWLQWLCDRQLERAQETAVDAGMSVGVIHDLPIGVDPVGADAWAQQADLARGMSIGAPPDPFNSAGQNWGAPPWNPRRLEATGFEHYRLMLRAALHHAGGLRIDHALGLFRLYWIPEGASAAEGTYVRYPAEAMLACLAIEAERSAAGVIAEDLGTVGEGVRAALRSWGIYGSAVLPFERLSDGRFRPPGQYRERTLASLTTHDLPTAPGFWTDAALEARDQAGMLTSETERERERAQNLADREALARVLERRGLLDQDAGLEERVKAMHAFVGQSRSLLAATSLTDALLEERQPNMPGTLDEYPNWRLPLSSRNGYPLPLEDVFEDAALKANVSALREQRSDLGSR